ncbi:hypothetical protein BV22DRAFT_706735 [Leucogyrophana mollusca]|uniref:Uncharacterized protein n=1 Tax=Leucogyrophana mollusca TaxID=85980 RepID=A0ACB8B7K5_9AGAM|nr:hypothetical protein BV22DRAFT_706735 [Leucogyrophana mollusca]
MSLVESEDVIRGNLGLNLYEKRVIMENSYAITAALIISREIPVAFLSTILSIESLCKREILLAWLCSIPSPVLGITQGLLKPVPLAMLMLLLPIALRLLGRFRGHTDQIRARIHDALLHSKLSWVHDPLPHGYC